MSIIKRSTLVAASRVLRELDGQGLRSEALEVLRTTLATATEATITCGGDDKERDKAVLAEAEKRTAHDLEMHPCGCNVCASGLLLYHLQVVRDEYGVCPYTGRAKTSG